jgi:hypothetical protein
MSDEDGISNIIKELKGRKIRVELRGQRKGWNGKKELEEELRSKSENKG